MSVHFTLSAQQFLKKLHGRSATELRVRGLQAAHAWLERFDLSPDVGEPNDSAFWRRLSAETRQRISVGDSASLLEQFRAENGANFFVGVADREGTIRELRSRWPDAERRIVARADSILSGSFDLLGYRALHFGDPIDWHRDPVAGRSAPRVHWTKIPYLDPSVVGDHKVIWELNRHQYFITLGRAYWLTGDERYATAIAGHLTSWMNDNPPKVGVNWASSLEISYRSLSWLWALHFLQDSQALTPSLFRRALGYFDLNARHIERYLSTFFSPNTHLTGEALGLLAIGTCVRQLAGAERWREIGIALLEQQLPLQVRRDGVYVEQSPHYHRYTVEIYLEALLLSRRGHRALSGVDTLLQAALDHAMFVTMPDGTFPLVGDDDGGMLLPLDSGPANDFRPALATAAALFGRNDYAAVAGGPSEQTLWLMGPKGLEQFDQLAPAFPDDTSKPFAEGGFFVMRDAWTPTSNYTLIDAGPHGYLSSGHAHADALSFVLSVSGEPVFVDPGTCVYSSNGVERNRFRASPAHNTVTVDGKSSSEPAGGPFQWHHMARTDVSCWSSSPQFDFICAEHDGFQRLKSPTRHERAILYAKEHYWVIRDRLTGIGAREIGLHFHCAPAVQASLESRQSVLLRVPSAAGEFDVTLTTFATDGSFELSDDWVCPEYGRKVGAKTCVFRSTAAGPAEFLTVVMAVPERHAATVEIVDGALEITVDGTRDVINIVPADDSNIGSVWTWLRTDVATGTILGRFKFNSRGPGSNAIEVVDADRSVGEAALVSMPVRDTSSRVS